MTARTLEDADREIAELKAANAGLTAELVALRAELAALRAELTTLKDARSKNSQNSHVPPSTERPGQQRGKKGKTGRKPGGQPGLDAEQPAAGL